MNLTFLLGVALGWLLASSIVAIWAAIEVWKMKKDRTFPYWMRNGMDDMRASQINMRFLLEDAKQWLDSLEREMRVNDELYGEIRRGTYDKDQPAKER